MNTHHTRFALGLSLSALVCGSTILVAQQPVASPALHSPLSLQIAPEGADRNSIRKFTGQQVRGANNERLGTIKDFVLEAKTGRILFAAVSSGGVAGIGDTLRLVPFQALKRTTDSDAFSSSMQASAWTSLPVISQEDFNADRINLTADQRRKLNDPHGPMSASGTARSDTTTAATTRTDTFDYGAQMIRAGKLRDKELRAGNNEVGEIEDVVIDFDRGLAVALVEPEDDFVRAEHDYLVPIGRLEFTLGKDQVTTQLTRADFEHAAAATATRREADRIAPRQQTSTTANGAIDRQAPVERSATRAGTPDERLTPTGRTSNQQNQLNASSTVESAARAISQLWAAQPELAKHNLRATAENGKLVLSGVVPSHQVWERAKDAAESIVTGIEIDNRIKVQAR